jgi:uncharacterized protein YlxW (UPF0749 family)
MKSSPLSIMLVVLLAAPAIRSQQGHGQSKLRRTVSQLQSEIEALQKSQQEMAEEIKALKELIGSGPPKPTNAAAFTTSLEGESILPVIDDQGSVVGTVDVESEIHNAFGPEVQRFLERCAEVVRPLWGGRLER